LVQRKAFFSGKIHHNQLHAHLLRVKLRSTGFYYCGYFSVAFNVKKGGGGETGVEKRESVPWGKSWEGKDQLFHINNRPLFKVGFHRRKFPSNSRRASLIEEKISGRGNAWGEVSNARKGEKGNSSRCSHLH